VEWLARAVDARDPYTQFHSANVAALVEQLAPVAGLGEEHAAVLVAAATLHDVGKIGIPDAVLRKPDRLDAEEYEIIKQHPALGAKILAASTRPEMLPWILEHHECWDGSGYPSGLVGEEISLEARILAVCDAYDAITTERPYRAAATPQQAIAELQSCAGTQFDPRIVELFTPLITSRKGISEESLRSESQLRS